LTKKEILNQLERDGVKLGKNPNRNFVYLQEKGLLPPPVGIKNKEALHHDFVPMLIKKIRKLQKERNTLEGIRYSIDDIIKKVKNELKTVEENRCKIHKFLNLKDEGQTYKVTDFMYRNKELWGGLIIAYYPDRITWFRIKNPNLLLNYENSKIIEKKTLTVKEYGNLVKTIAIDTAKRGLRRFTENDELDVIFPKRKVDYELHKKK
jgi:hypothetical protein